MSQQTPHNLGEALERLRGKWAAFVCFGALLTAMGAASLIFAFATTLAMATINGVFFIIAGFAEIGVGAHARQWNRFFFWVLGAAAAALSVYMVRSAEWHDGRPDTDRDSD